MRRSLDGNESAESDIGNSAENGTAPLSSPSEGAPPGINPNDRVKLEPKCQEPREPGNGTQSRESLL